MEQTLFAGEMQRVADSLHLRRSVAFLLNGLAVTGMLLAVVGLYGSLCSNPAGTRGRFRKLRARSRFVNVRPRNSGIPIASSFVGVRSYPDGARRTGG